FISLYPELAQIYRIYPSIWMSVTTGAAERKTESQIAQGNFRLINPSDEGQTSAPARSWMQRKEISMSVKVIAARFTDAPVKLDDSQQRSVLTTLKMIYDWGSLDEIARRMNGWRRSIYESRNL